MAKQILLSGTVANDKTGDTLRNASGKINQNFNELYTALGNGSALTVAAVAKSGSYNDLTNKPTLFSGSYNDLIDVPNPNTGDSIDLSAITQSIIPVTDITYDLGSDAKRFRDLYLSGNTINLGNSAISSNGQGGITVDGVLTSWTGKYTVTGIEDYVTNSPDSIVYAVGDRIVVTDTNTGPGGRPGPFVNGAYATIRYEFNNEGIAIEDQATWNIEYDGSGYISAITMLTAGGPVSTTDQLEIIWNPNPSSTVTPIIYTDNTNPVVTTETLWDANGKTLYLDKDYLGNPISVSGSGWTGADLYPITRDYNNSSSRNRQLRLPDGSPVMEIGVLEDCFKFMYLAPTQEPELINPAAPNNSQTFSNLSVTGDLRVTGDIHVSPNSLYLGSMKLSTDDGSTLLINNSVLGPPSNTTESEVLIASDPSTTENIVDIDFSKGCIEVLLDSSVTGFTYSNIPGTLKCATTVVIFTQNSSGNKTISGDFKTQDGAGIDIDYTANSVSIVSFFVVNKGITPVVYAFNNGTNFI